MITTKLDRSRRQPLLSHGKGSTKKTHRNSKNKSNKKYFPLSHRARHRMGGAQYMPQLKAKRKRKSREDRQAAGICFFIFLQNKQKRKESTLQNPLPEPS